MIAGHFSWQSPKKGERGYDRKKTTDQPEED